MKIEYLIVFKTNDNVCKSIKTFKNLMQTDDAIILKDSYLLYETLKIKTKIGNGQIVDKSQTFFQLELNYEEDNSPVLIQDLLKRIRTLIIKFGGEMNILWDDLGISNATKAYPIICETENLLRKLISKFMLTNIGTNWTKETLPHEVKEAADKNKRPSINFLHNVDFIHLADFLFKAYSTKANSELYEKIKRSIILEDLDLAELKSYLPKSNWQRYFKKVVECEDDFFSKRWLRLYELRCLVAHNNFITELELNEIVELSSQLRIPILEAIDKLNEIIIPDEEKEQVVEHVAVNLNEGVGEFLNIWKNIISSIKEAYKNNGGLDINLSAKMQVKFLIEKGLLNKDFLDNLDPLGAFRNSLVYGDLSSRIDAKQLTEKNNEIYNFYAVKILFEPPFF